MVCEDSFTGYNIYNYNFNYLTDSICSDNLDNKSIKNDKKTKKFNKRLENNNSIPKRKKYLKF